MVLHEPALPAEELQNTLNCLKYLSILKSRNNTQAMDKIISLMPQNI